MNKKYNLLNMTKLIRHSYTLGILISSVCLFSFSCNRGPKVIAIPVQTESHQNSLSSGIFQSQQANPSNAIEDSSNNLHTIIALEVKDTEKYTYIRVREANQEYWIATGKKDVILGATYFYSAAIRKTNFESKEFGRVFDEIFLVGNIVSEDHGNQMRQENIAKVDVETHSTSTPVKSSIGSGLEGLTKIKNLVKDPNKFENRIIRLEGLVDKVNTNILGRNWIHLKDGSMDEYDLVITSIANVTEGSRIKIEGKVALGVDFGAGYRYDIIVENAEIL